MVLIFFSFTGYEKKNFKNFVSLQNYKGRSRGRNGRKSWPSEYDDRQFEKHGNRHGIRNGQPEQTTRQTRCQGGE